MAVEFTCPSCTSRHAVAEHVAGRPFRCSGCGKMLVAPTTSGTTAREAVRPASRGEYDEHQDRTEQEMGTGLQMTLLIIGGGVLLLLLLFCFGGVGMFIPRMLHKEGEAVKLPGKAVEDMPERTGEMPDQPDVK